MTADDLHGMSEEYQHRYERTGYDPHGMFRPQMCRHAGHVFGCPCEAGGDAELLPGWITYEDEHGLTVDVEVAK